VKLHALVHASIWIEAGDKQIFVDPVSHLGNRSIDYTTMLKSPKSSARKCFSRIIIATRI